MYLGGTASSGRYHVVLPLITTLRRSRPSESRLVRPRREDTMVPRERRQMPSDWRKCQDFLREIRREVSFREIELISSFTRAASGIWIYLLIPIHDAVRSAHVHTEMHYWITSKWYANKYPNDSSNRQNGGLPPRRKNHHQDFENRT